MKQEIKDRVDMIKNRRVPTGYKKNELDIIPQEWESIALKEIISALESGISVNSDDTKCKNGEYGILKTSCVNNGKFIPSEHKRIINSEIKRAKLNPQKGRVVISRMNTPELVGQVGYVDKDYLNLFIPDRLWQTKFSEEIDSKWLVNLLVLDKVKYRIKSIATGTSNSMKNISKDKFLNIMIMYPPFPEQQKIASILSTWDKDIELKEKFIEEKKKQKKGLMQKLLTGDIRLPGFDGEWKEVRLGDIVSKIIDNRGKTPPVTNEGVELIEVAALEGNHIHPRYDKVIKYVDEYTYDNWFRSGHPIKDDILIATVGSVGTCALMGLDRGAIAQNIIGLRIDNLYNSMFVYWIINSSRYYTYIREITMGAVQPSIKVPQLLDFRFSIPDLEESKNISAILATVDNEITLLEQELEALKLQKKGLMQLLLTGIVRVNTEN